MNSAALLLAVCMPVSAIDMQDGKVVLMPAEHSTLQTCAEQDGCVVVTRAGILALLNKVIAMTLNEAGKGCRKENWL